MASEPGGNASAKHPPFSRRSIERSIGHLQDRINELKAFNVALVTEGQCPELLALSEAIRDTLDRAFGEGTIRFLRFSRAIKLQFSPIAFGDNYPKLHHYQEGARKNTDQSIVLLTQAQRTLNEDLADAEGTGEREDDTKPPHETSHRSKKIFIVHGHDEGARESVARYLEQLGLKPIVLHEVASVGLTVIEKIEAQADIGFAVVLLTPDDQGGVAGGELGPRARQNVLLELGYFMGRLGRNRVCTLKKGEVDIPSDFAGVVWQPMDNGGGWRQSLGKVLEAAGYDIDWNKVMRRP